MPRLAPVIASLALLCHPIRFNCKHQGSTAETNRGIGAAAGNGGAPRPADDSQLSAGRAAAEKPIRAVLFEPRHGHSRRHIDPLQHLSGSRIDPPEIALVTLPRAMPELAVDPGDPGDEPLGFDGALNRAGLRIDLMNLPVPV